MSPSLDNGLTISHFRIIAPLGEGGMGEVYKAWDSELERTIALKVLPPDRVSNEERLSRFVKEAKSASALAHPASRSARYLFRWYLFRWLPARLPADVQLGDLEVNDEG